ncbi:hypothetical protein AMB3_3225 [plant metagenome]
MKQVTENFRQVGDHPYESGEKQNQKVHRDPANIVGNWRDLMYHWRAGRFGHRQARDIRLPSGLPVSDRRTSLPWR